MLFFIFVSLILMCNGKAPTKKGVEAVKLKESFQKAGIPEDLEIAAPKHKLQVISCCSLSSFFFQRRGNYDQPWSFWQKIIYLQHNYHSLKMRYNLLLITCKGCVSFAPLFGSWRHTWFE